MTRASILGAILPACLWGQFDPEALLQQARAKIVENVAKLPKYTCVQTIERSRFELLYAARARGCNQPAPAKPKGVAQNRPMTMLAWTDRFKLDVTVSDGAEIFSWAGAREFQSADAQEIVGGGMTGSGDFGPFLMDIFGSDAPKHEYVGLESDQGRPLAVYRYAVPAAASRYQMKLGPRSKDMATLAYEGEFWIDPQSAELRKMTIVVPHPPPHAETCRVETSIDYQQVRIGGAPLLLPQATLLKLWDADGSRYENRIGYAACRAFQSESVFRPETEAGESATPAVSSAATAALAIPAGLTLNIALHSPIDMATAFAGDAIEGQLEQAIHGPDGRTLAPEGTIVRGRIVRAERHSVPSSYFALGLRFHALVLHGVEVPLALDPVPHSAEARMLTDALEKGQGIGMFVFHGDLRILDQGFDSEWRTSSRKATE